MFTLDFIWNGMTFVCERSLLGIEWTIVALGQKDPIWETTGLDHIWQQRNEYKTKISHILKFAGPSMGHPLGPSMVLSWGFRLTFPLARTSMGFHLGPQWACPWALDGHSLGPAMGRPLGAQWASLGPSWGRPSIGPFMRLWLGPPWALGSTCWANENQAYSLFVFTQL